MQIGMGYWASKAVLSAVNFGLFTMLAAQSKKMKEIKDALQLQTTDRHVFDWLDALVSLGFLKREGLLENAMYSDSPDTEMFLDEKKPSYIGGILKMSNNRLYGFWGHLDDGLKTGEAQNESHGDSDMNFFNDLYKDPEKLSEFVDAMSGIQMGNFMMLSKKFNFSKFSTMADIGGADGFLSCMVAREHPSVNFITYDLPPVAPVAKKKIEKFNLSDRIKVESGDFLKDPIPSAQLITMGNILHGLNEDTKQDLVKKVYDALPANGAFMTIENIIDNERKQNTFGLLMSLNMLIENGDAFDYTMNDFDRWAKAAGFKRTELLPLAGPTSAAIAYKD
jgi:cyclopropane fatty-acyl-phospholipid synthase-like methyltransferase